MAKNKSVKLKEKMKCLYEYRAEVHMFSPYSVLRHFSELNHLISTPDLAEVLSVGPCKCVETLFSSFKWVGICRGNKASGSGRFCGVVSFSVGEEGEEPVNDPEDCITGASKKI